MSKTTGKLAKQGMLQLPCLGMPFQLGMLYDCRSDQLIPGVTLWDNKLLKSACSETSQPNHSVFEVITEDSIPKRMSSLGVEPDFSLSVISGSISGVSGAAKYLDDHRASANQARVTLQYTFTSKFQQLTMEQLASSNIQHPDDVFVKGTATHVVTGVSYGAEAFFVFDREVRDSENYRNVQGKMEVLVKALPGISEIKGSPDLVLSDRDKQEVEKFQCKFYGDFIINSNLSSFQDAVQVCKDLPSYFGKNTVPKKVWLYPLNKLDSRAARMVKEISTSLVKQAQQAIECLVNIEMRSHDLANTEVCEFFLCFNDQISQLMEMIIEHKLDFMKRLSSMLPFIRGGGVKEQELADLLEARMHTSPFNPNSLELWMKSKEEEAKVLSQYLEIMKKIRGVTMAIKPGELDAAINSVEYDHVLSFEFKVIKKNNSFLHNLFSFLRNGTISSTQDGSPGKQWFKNGVIIKDLRQKAKQFSAFAEANAARSKDVKFIVSASSGDEGHVDEGAVIMHYEFGTCSGPFEPPRQPRKPTANDVKHTSVQIEWKALQCPNSASLQCYVVSYRCVHNTRDAEWKMQKTKCHETTMIVNQLSPETKYVFKVCAESILGNSEDSDTSDVIVTKPAPVNLRLQTIISESTILTTNPPATYKIKARPVHLPKKHKNITKWEFGTPPHPPKPTKVLMLVGATGAGKSTQINGIVNYLLGVKWENDFRFKLIGDEVSQSQAHSQTQMVTAYTFYWQEGSPLNCNLTIIDTPGFGDTRGLERDQRITENIKEFFELKEKQGGLDVLHAIGFVTQASLARLTPTQKYISDSILSIFGKDIEDNIFIMTTFADGGDPPVMGAVREAKIPHADFFPFNNSALFVNPSKSNFSKMFWEMGYASLENFFCKFQQAKPVSLQLTRQVLEEREHLETIINGIQPQINTLLAKMDELQQEEQVLKRHESKILANEDFTYEILVTKQRQSFTPYGKYVTNCANCNYTCHPSCVYADDRDKYKCSAMDGGDESNACCKVCPGQCSWKKHFNNGYIFELYEEYETRTKQELLDRYNQAKSAKANVEGIIGSIEKELQDMQNVVLLNIRRARKCLKRLDEIALRPNPLSEVEYIDILIQSEKQQAQPGWKNRIDYFYKVRQQAEILSKVKDPSEFERVAAQSSKTIWKRFTSWWKGPH